jgi:hypothetical protein
VSSIDHQWRRFMSNGGETDAMKVPITQSREERSARASVCGSAAGKSGRSGRVLRSWALGGLAQAGRGWIGWLGAWAQGARSSVGLLRVAVGARSLSWRWTGAVGRGAGVLGCVAAARLKAAASGWSMQGASVAREKGGERKG